MADNMERLTAIFGQVSEHTASYDVYATATYYPTITKVYIPFRPYQKLHPWAELTDDSKEKLANRKSGLPLITDNTETNIERLSSPGRRSEIFRSVITLICLLPLPLPPTDMMSTNPNAA